MAMIEVCRNRIYVWFLIALLFGMRGDSRLGDHDWRRHLPGLVGQCHGKVGRVGDDDIRLGHGSHHAAHGDFALFALDPRTNFGIAFGVLGFVFDFLFGHFELFFKLTSLPQVVANRKDHRG